MRENFGKFGESGAIHQSFTCSNLQLKTVDIVNGFNIEKNVPDKGMYKMSILKYFHSVKQKPVPSGPLREAVPSTAIAAANVMVATFNKAKVKRSASRVHGSYLFLTSLQKHEVANYV